MHDLEELTTHCIRCGFCLEDCPTFVETGNELESPRGRIYLVRSAIEGKLAWKEDVKPHLDLCLGCRACETACPSAVQYGAILEIARDKIDQTAVSLAKEALLASTTNPTILKAQLAMGKVIGGGKVPGFVSRLLSKQEPEAEMPTSQATPKFPALELDTPVKGEVYMLTGCAMRVLYPRVHECTKRLLRRVGYIVREVEQGCCGALHAHNGDLEGAAKMASALVEALEGDLPVIVDSAGCGSTMKEYGSLIGEAGTAFAKRTFDISEFLLTNGLADLLKDAPGLDGKRVTYHDACHLSHGQKITASPRQLISAIPNMEFAELPESMMCCGSAGIYNILQPKMARQLLDRKVGHIQETEADIVATGNPGCHAWIAQGCREQKSATVLHTTELLEAAFIGLEHFV
ncbi:MAG: 4Fe-4S dicluster domain-containing protein [Armatimonadetes bacterium]|nr:4Fe-4S dicluster domain-containing protein [Armatimonadota bacterium]